MWFGFQFAIGVILAVFAVCFAIAVIAVIRGYLKALSARLATHPQFTYARDAKGQLHVTASR